MAKLGSVVQKVRSKNAGPFWLTIDIFCGDRRAFDLVVALQTDQVAALFKVPVDQLKRFDIPSLNVVKFSLPRPVVQGLATDRDMHGAGWAVLLEEMDIG